jgi:Effector-associated domain 2
VVQQELAVPRTILVVDVEKFSDHVRSDRQRVIVHDGLYDALIRAFRAAGIRWDDCGHEDRGDGVMVLAPPSVPKVLFSEALPGRLADELQRHNAARRPEEQIRLRMALNAGEVFINEHGAVSSELNTTFRLLDAGQLKEALRGSPGPLACIAPAWFYYQIIQNGEAFRPETYFPVLVEVKEISTVAWISTPGYQAARYGRDESWRIRLRDNADAIHGPGILVRGRYAITSAHVAARALGLPAGYIPGRLAGRVWFDLPSQPEEGVRQAEVIWWSPVLPADGEQRWTGVAGLSVVGPAIPGISEPDWQPDLEPGPRIVQLHAVGAADGGSPGRCRWARTPDYPANGADRVPLSTLTEFSPALTSECQGSFVIDEATGGILGIAETLSAGNSREHTSMIAIGRIMDAWPVLRRIAAHGGRGAPDNRPGHACRSAAILPLAASSLLVPMLAKAASRHALVSELPLDVLLTAPRSTVDRADLIALIWSCAKVPGALTELAAKIRESSYGGMIAAELADSLERFQAELLPGPLP